MLRGQLRRAVFRSINKIIAPFTKGLLWGVPNLRNLEARANILYSPFPKPSYYVNKLGRPLRLAMFLYRVCKGILLAFLLLKNGPGVSAVISEGSSDRVVVGLEFNIAAI